MPGRVPATPIERRQKRIGINISFLWLLFPIVDLAQSDASAAARRLVATGIAAFVAIYNWLPFERPPVERTARDRASSLTLLTLASPAR